MCEPRESRRLAPPRPVAAAAARAPPLALTPPLLARGWSQELNPNSADTEALTTFYTTLYEQRPDSELAARFLLQHGLLPGGEAEAKQLVKKFGKAASSSKGGGGGGGSKAPAKKKASKDEDDFVEAKPKKPPAKKPAAKKPAADSSDEEFEEKKKKPAAAAAKKPPAKRPNVPPEDSSDEDDVPLSKKMKKK